MHCVVTYERNVNKSQYIPWFAWEPCKVKESCQVRCGLFFPCGPIAAEAKETPEPDM